MKNLITGIVLTCVLFFAASAHATGCNSVVQVRAVRNHHVQNIVQVERVVVRNHHVNSVLQITEYPELSNVRVIERFEVLNNSGHHNNVQLVAVNNHHNRVDVVRFVDGHGRQFLANHRGNFVRVNNNVRFVRRNVNNNRRFPTPVRDFFQRVRNNRQQNQVQRLLGGGQRFRTPIRNFFFGR